ncbi:hypothetical protein JXA31_06400 [Candidatus Bathyarchaeota archaeon]|nr:hypothetical protein [Candidatus Bathyarchaeota archaeon]
MKAKIVMLLLTSIMVISAFSVIQVYARPRDKSDVALATYETDWVIVEEGPLRWHYIENGDARRWQQHIIIKNTGDEPLANALIRVRFWGVTFVNGTKIGYDSGGNDALAIVDGLVSVTNGKKLPLERDGAWMVAYYISVGTIQPGHSKNVLVNIWTDGQIVDWSSYFTLWVPTND